MRVFIEVENEQEKMVITDQIDKAEKTFDKDIEIIYANKKSGVVLDKIEKLKWDMGRKFYKGRESL